MFPHVIKSPRADTASEGTILSLSVYLSLHLRLFPSFFLSISSLPWLPSFNSPSPLSPSISPVRYIRFSLSLSLPLSPSVSPSPSLSLSLSLSLSQTAQMRPSFGSQPRCGHAGPQTGQVCTGRAHGRCRVDILRSQRGR